LRFSFYGGKGGVGKTTCAAARAVTEAASGRRVLLISTDPAHSLGDALGVRLTPTPRRIRARLSAVELDASRAFRRWLLQHRRPLGDILEQGTWLDREDVEALLDLSIPGVDELVALLEITRLANPHATDCVVVDTAPTGHALRMLAAPETVGAVAEALDTLHETHRVIREQLARVGGADASDRLIELLAKQSQEIAATLRDRTRTSVHWVTLAEDLSVEETSDALAALDATKICVDEIIINRVVPAGPLCPVCDRRRVLESQALRRISRRVARGRTVRLIPAEILEPRGATALARIGRALTRRGRGVRLRARRTGQPVGSPAMSLAPDATTIGPESIDAFSRARLLFFTGKGGVGKTTTAAATAVRLAQDRSDARVLLLSTDPAHSLADVFDDRVDDTPRRLRGAPHNLFVREVDARRAVRARRAAIEAAVDEIAALAGAGMVAADRVGSGLVDLAPPGIDELFGMLTILAARTTYDVIVVDTAPTGHALRLLEVPETLREWVQVLLRVLLKYRSVARPGALASELVELSRSIRELLAWLRDPAQTHFVVVTRAAEVPLAETKRLVRRLRRMSLAVSAVIVNARTLAPGSCPRCRAMAAAERRCEATLPISRRSRSQRCVIIETPLAAPPPRGARRLESWGGKWLMAEWLVAERRGQAQNSAI
jgi:arsenite/tail-anchored protein-transporting ATPase